MDNSRKSLGDLNVVFRCFHAWLIDSAKMTKNSADQYHVYIRKLSAAADEEFGHGWFDGFIANYLTDRKRKRSLQCAAFIARKIREASGKTKRSLLNWRSAFHAFDDFLDDDIDALNFDKKRRDNNSCQSFMEPACSVQGKPLSFSPKSDMKTAGEIRDTYEHKELLGKFKSRLNTQGRYYPKIKIKLLFPTRLINTKIFHGRNNEWTTWIKDGIESMQVFGRERTVLFKDVKRLDFHIDNSVWVTLNDGSSFQLMTKKADGKIVPERAVRGAADVTVDHNPPLENVLSSKCERLVGLRRLTELFALFEKESGERLNPRSDRAWKDAFYERFKEDIDTDQMRALLIKDLGILKFQYELMDGKENSKKGKKRG